MDLTQMLGQGNPALQSMLEGLKDYRVEPPPSPEARQGALQSYVSAVQNAGKDERQPWEVMLEGRLLAGNPLDAQQATPAGFRALANWDATQRESKRVRDVMAAKLQYDEMLKQRQDFDREFAPLIRAAASSNKAAGNRFEPRRNADGTTTVFDKSTGQPVGTYGPQDIGKIASLTQSLASKYLEKGDYTTLEEATQAAQAEALRMFNSANAAVGNRQAPLTGDQNLVGGLPRTSPPGATHGIAPPTVQPSRIELAPEMLAGLPKVAQETAQRLAARMNANPASIPADMPRLEALLLPGGMPKKNVQVEEEKKSYGSGIGKHMADTSVDIQKTGSAAQSLLGDLNVMESLYKEHGDKIPEGALGPYISSIRSGLKSLGVEVQGQGPTDVINALATKQALKSRTADGENLLPGAMSNYEDRLLQSMSPGLLMTQEGRMMAIQVAKAQMDMKVKLAAGAREYIKNKGRLDQGWDEVAAKYAETNPFLNESRIRALELYSKSLVGGKK